MDTQKSLRRFPKLKFRVLVIGRANAGKTSILKRVCDTTERPLKNGIRLNPSMDRGQHDIYDQFVFSDDDGYVFHDSRGFESGDDKELKIVQDFVRQKSGENRLVNRLHAIWYCIPMDNQRPELELKHFKDICPDQNVPVIAVFTKYDQFKQNVEMDLEDAEEDCEPEKLLAAIEKRFQDHYLSPLGDGAKFVRLEQMHKPDGYCKHLVEETAGALNDDVVALMLVAVQRDNLELSVRMALRRVHPLIRDGVKIKKVIVKQCLVPFPYIWLDDDDLLDLDLDDDDLDDDHLRNSVKRILSVPIIQEFRSDNGHHLILALPFILVHATKLRASGSRLESALAQAESHYQSSNIGLKIAKEFPAPLQEYSIPKIAAFIMGLDD